MKRFQTGQLKLCKGPDKIRKQENIPVGMSSSEGGGWADQPSVGRPPFPLDRDPPEHGPPGQGPSLCEQNDRQV